MELNKNKAKIMYIFVLGIFFIFAIRGIREGKIFGIDNYVFMIYIVLTRIVYLLLHELSHVFALKIKKLKIREFKIYGFRYDGMLQKLEFSIKEFDFSGYVVPWITYDIDTDDNFAKFKSAYIFSLLAGPLMPFVVCLAIYLIEVVFSLPLEVFTFTFFINAVLMLVSSFMGNQGSMGDIQSVVFFYKDANFASQLIEDLHLLKEHISEKERNYLNKIQQ